MMEHAQVLMEVLDREIERTQEKLKALLDARDALCGGNGLIAKAGAAEVKPKRGRKKK